MKEITATKKFYDARAAHWIQHKTNSFYYESQFTTLFKLWKPKAKILDIGCAGGLLVPLFLGVGQGTKYHGVDISKTFLKTAQKRYPQLTFTQGNIADDTTLPKGKFDGFVAAAVLMHIPFTLWDQTFKNIETRMQPGAIGFITLPTEHPNLHQDDTDTRHFTLLSTDEQKAYLRGRGWKIKSSGVCDGFTKNGIWNWYIVQLPK